MQFVDEFRDPELAKSWFSGLQNGFEPYLHTANFLFN